MRALALAFLFLIPLRAVAAPRWLYFFGTTDRHGALEPVETPGRPQVGGAARLATVLKIARAREPGRVLLVDSGDLFQGTMESNLVEGASIITAMNALDYAASAVGNHEFDFGPVGPHVVVKAAGDDPRGALKARASEARFPFLLANVVAADGKRLFPAYTLVERDHVEIGLVGGVSEDLPRTTLKNNLSGLVIQSLPAAIADAARDARLHGAQVVVALIHAGGKCVPPTAEALSDAAPGSTKNCEDDAEAWKVARALPPHLVDAIFAGHTHQIVSAVVAGTPIAQGAPNGLGFSEIDVEVDEHGRPTGHFRLPPPRLLDDHPFWGTPVTPDAAMTTLIAPALERARAARARPVGVTLSATLHRIHSAESPLGNLVADVLRQATHTEIGLMNGGGVRADLPGGPLTYGELFEVLPFDNTLAVQSLTGATLRALLTNNLRGKKGVLSVSGITVHASCRGSELVVDVTLANGQPLDDARTYRIGTNDFLALGGDDFGALKSKMVPPEIDESVLVRDAVAGWLAQRHTLDANDRALFDPAHLRLNLPMARPVLCGAPTPSPR